MHDTIVNWITKHSEAFYEVNSLNPVQKAVLVSASIISGRYFQEESHVGYVPTRIILKIPHIAKLIVFPFNFKQKLTILFVPFLGSVILLASPFEVTFPSACFLYRSKEKLVFDLRRPVWVPRFKMTSSFIYIVRSAHKLRARRTVCKSVFFSNDINCWREIRGLFGLKGRGLGDSATCRPSEYHWKTIVNI
jgi:hypothetical protein